MEEIGLKLINEGEYMKKNDINYLAEFHEKIIEKEYFQKSMKNSLSYIRYIVLMLGILNTLFLIPDYYLVSNNKFVIIIILRIIFIILVGILFVYAKHMKNINNLAYWITSYEIISILLFLYVCYQYESPNYLIQAFGVMTILLSVFLVPNRWINTIVASIFVIIGFAIMSIYFIDDIVKSEFWAGIVYIIIVAILCSLFSFQNHYYKRIDYINKKELIALAITDPLSKAYNRIKLNDELARWVSYSKRYNTPLSLVILDFDNFKKVNDNYGHLIGDKVIIDAARIVKNTIREIDIFARWGGEEFTILLPNTELKQALEVAERVRMNIESYEFEVVKKVTSSFGVAQLLMDENIESLISRTDRKLYEAKDKGKNRVAG